MEHAFATPQIGPEALEALGAEAVLIDGRPWDEHAAFTLPGALSCPNAELALRAPLMAAPGRPVVVHCAGRTRSIIGAQTLRDFGLSNPVAALRDGTQGWELSGRTRVIGAPSAPAPEPDAAALADAEARARAVMAREAIPTLDAAALDRLLAEDPRTVLRLDPRIEGTPPPGFRRAPGTTLAQCVDRYIAVRGAMVALFDPELVRAVFAALWLRRMGIDARVLEGAPPATDARPAPAPALPSPPLLDARALADGSVIDLRPSPDFAAARLPGALWATRARLPQARGAALVAADATVGAAAFADLAAAGLAPRGVSPTGPQDWRAAGLAVDDAPAPVADAPDVVRFCAGRHTGNLADARSYLDWEKGLLARLDAHGLNPWTH